MLGEHTPPESARAPETDLLPGLLTTAVFTAAFCSLALGSITALAIVSERSFRYYSQDAATVLDGTPFVGALGNVVVLIGWGAAAACLFAGALIARTRGWRASLPLLALSVGTGYLALDDLFLLHEFVYPTKFGIRENVVYVVYLVAAIVFFWWFRNVFREHEWPLLALAVVLLLASQTLDVRPGDLWATGTGLRWLEEGLKLFGFGFLAAYVLRLSARMLVTAFPPRAAGWTGPSEG